jgi:hypothetical protein
MTEAEQQQRPLPLRQACVAPAAGFRHGPRLARRPRHLVRAPFFLPQAPSSSPPPSGWGQPGSGGRRRGRSLLVCAVPPQTSAQVTLDVQVRVGPSAAGGLPPEISGREGTGLVGVFPPPSPWEPELLVFSLLSRPLPPPGLCQVPVTQEPLPSPGGLLPALSVLGGRRRRYRFTWWADLAAHSHS